MEKETSLTPKSGIRKRINNVIEFIKSKVDKKYVLSPDSPDF